MNTDLPNHAAMKLATQVRQLIISEIEPLKY